MICNGVNDCPDGEDERSCDHMTCIGLLVCHHDRLCVHPTQICDGILQCPTSRDDESMCGPWQCPQFCRCWGHLVKCVDKFPSNIDIHVRSKALILRNITLNSLFSLSNGITLIRVEFTRCSFPDNFLSDKAFFGLRMLHILILRNCNIRVIQKYSFRHLKHVVVLVITGNHIQHINPDTWNHFVYLPNMDLSNMLIKRVYELSFVGLTNMKIMNLSNNHLTELSNRCFDGMPKLFILDIRNNHIASVEQYSLLTVGVSLFTDSNIICCYTNSVSKCMEINIYSFAMENTTLPSVDDQCPNIIEHEIVQRTFLYIASILAILHFLGFIHNASIKQQSHLILMQHLNLANSLFTIYIIAVTGISFIRRGDYIFISKLWDTTYACRTLNVMLLWGGLLTKAALCLVSFNQLICTKYALERRPPTGASALFAISVVWCITVTFSIISVYGFQSSIRISCNISTPQSTLSRIRRIIFHFMYIFVICAKTLAITVVYQQITAFVKESSERVRSTRNATQMNRRLMHRTCCIVFIEWTTVIAMILLLIQSYFGSSKPHMYVVLVVCCSHCIPHCCMYIIHPFLKMLLKKSRKQILKKSN